MEIFMLTILNAITAWTVVNILTQPSEILAPLYKVITKLPKWLHKPLISCDRCFGGQLTLWTYPLLSGNYEPVSHIYSITLTIFLVVIINKIFYNAA